MRAAWILITLWLAPWASAQQASPETGSAQAPMSAEEVQRLKVLSAELRCLVCQNQSLADSNAELAVDLRNQVRDQIRAGQSDAQIKDYLVQRYGEFVLYRPRVSGVTVLLWVGPFLLLALGGAAMWTYVRRRQRAQAGTEESGVTPDSQARLAHARSLLNAHEQDGETRAAPAASERPS